MKITCSQFEGLMTFYIDNELSEKLTTAFEEHMKNCPNCSMKFKVIKSIVNDIKTAYDKIICENNYQPPIETDIAEGKQIDPEDLSNLDLSAYIDNELSEENSIRVRKNLIAKPTVRKKLERMYKLRKILSGSFSEQKNLMRNDFSKDVIRSINADFSAKEVCIHCFIFIFVVLLAIALSVWSIVRVL